MSNDTAEYQILAQYIDPEFGGFCLTARFDATSAWLSSRFCSERWLAGYVRQSWGLTSRSPDSTSAGMALAISEAEIRAAESSSSLVDANGTTKAGSASGDGLASSLTAEASPGPKPGCQGATPGNEQGCSFFKPRRVRVRALTDAPEMGRIAVGRPAAPSVATAPQNSPAKLPVSEIIEEKSPSAVARAQPSVNQALSARPVSKKLQRDYAEGQGACRWSSIPRRATGPIPGMLGRKIMPVQLDGPMRERPLRPAKGFGIGPGDRRSPNHDVRRSEYGSSSPTT